ncbi:hypothetical protein [Megasphaera hominis]|jgi:hypothetical protein|uniref:Uncharacterized protein n=1 Tax=Megasphaera hominis TaxID=159836 RepID=A0ABR6VJF0_9FIRM|nr:hypothetical protein [Megasphaera hominis]MBC3537341.1 hypothetical protein [Megasphaera hominis]
MTSEQDLIDMLDELLEEVLEWRDAWESRETEKAEILRDYVKWDMAKLVVEIRCSGVTVDKGTLTKLEKCIEYLPKKECTLGYGEECARRAKKYIDALMKELGAEREWWNTI